MVKLALDKHAYRGAPRRIGSSWTAVEANPPSEHGWKEHNQRKNWNWKPRKRLRTPRQVLSPKQQAERLLAKLLSGAK